MIRDANAKTSTTNHDDKHCAKVIDHQLNRGLLAPSVAKSELIGLHDGRRRDESSFEKQLRNEVVRAKGLELVYFIAALP